MNDQVVKTTLSNNLLVFLKEIHTAPLISSWLWYRVGSRNETAGRTGISHWVEHMLFKGTPQFPSNILDKAISRDGGVWNAFTTMDWTTFFETMPADKIDVALRLEADRMVNAAFDPDEVASERTVVISEREGNENEPLFLLGEAVQAASFRVHSYHHQVIGDMTDLQAMNRDDLYQHYRTYYIPNNAVMAVAGDFESEKMLARIRELYESIPAGPVPMRVGRPEPPQRGEIQLSVEGPGETTYIQVAYHFPAASHSHFFPLAVLDNLLAGPSNLNMFSGGISNKTSRLHRALIEKGFAVSMEGGAQATLEPFLYNIILTIHQERTPEEALAALDDEIKRIQDDLVTTEEIARAVKQARALFAYGTENITNQAFWMGYAETFADYDWFLNYLDRLAAVTPADVQQVAQTWLRQRSRIVGTYLPANASEKTE